MILVQFWESLMPECGKEGIIVGQAMLYTRLGIKWDGRSSQTCAGI